MSSGFAARDFRDLARAIRALADVPARAAKTASRSIYKLVMREFTSESGPYGAKWAPLTPWTVAYRESLGYGAGPILTRTGALKASVTVRPMGGTGIALTIGADYAVHHQYGFTFTHRSGNKTITKDVPARPLFPNRDLPASWRKAIDAAVAKAYGSATKRAK